MAVKAVHRQCSQQLRSDWRTGACRASREACSSACILAAPVLAPMNRSMHVELLCRAHRLICCLPACRYGFVVYTDPTVTDVACAGLHGMRMADRTLTVRRATEVNGRSNFEMVCCKL